MQLLRQKYMFLCSSIFSLSLIAAPIAVTAGEDKDDDKRDKYHQSHHDKYHHTKAIEKVEGKLSVMVLGSGGPAPTPSGRRASSGYLIFTDGEPRILMDTGGGTYANLAKSGVNIKDLDIVLFSHLHIDHMADMSAMVKALYFQNRADNVNPDTPASFPPGRTKAIRFFGPNENGITFQDLVEELPDVPQYPATDTFVNARFDINTGIERYLHIFGRAISGGIFDFQASNLSPNWLAYEPETVINEKGLKITSVGVNHGPVPAVAYRIEYKGKSIVFSGDTSSRSTDPNGNPLPNGGNMVAISKDADLLIYDTAIMDELPNGPRDAVFFALHTTPSRMGEVATAANARKLVLSHITGVTEPRLDEVKDLVRAQGYKGDISVAHDLKVYNLDD
jgi:ribonuclease BN (tRNA processing enzyme)